MNAKESGSHSNEQPPLNKWAAVAAHWVLPVSLAFILGGQIVFSATQFYLGIQHPAWPFWGLMGASVLLVGFCRAFPTRLTAIDIAMTSFALVLIASFAISGLGSTSAASLNIATFVVLPYVAGRFLDRTALDRQLNFLVWIAAMAVLLTVAGLLSLPETELMSDRLKTLFTIPDTSSLAGVSSIPHASTALGLLVILWISVLSAPTSLETETTDFLHISLIGAAIWLLLFLALRGAIIAALLVGAIQLLAGRGSMNRRIVLLLLFASAVGASYTTLPEDRERHLGQLSIVGQQSINEPNYSVKGNSIATRIELFRNAVTRVREAPWFGVGAGNIGIAGDCKSCEGFLSPHSTILQAFAELGLIGGISFLSFIAIIIYEVVRIQLQDAGEVQSLGWLLATVWCFFVLLDQFSGNYFSGYHFFAVSGMISSLVSTSRPWRYTHQVQGPPVTSRFQ